jgi:hypothetical protein
MPRQPLSPVKAQSAATDHAQDAAQAAVTVSTILAGTDGLSDSARTHALANAAKTLEAAGCYIRRQHSKGLLIP